ncbi:MAG: hypothetical protein ABIP44_00780 [Pseudoxanthomonas sp.]
MIDTIASSVVVLAGTYLLALGLAAWFAPAIARRFLLGFASSAAKHYAELALRIAVGAALVVHAPHSDFPRVFGIAGWLVLATSAGLLLVPWRLHQRFAQWAVPQAMRYFGLMGAVSIVLGGLIVLEAIRGGR